MIQTVQLSEKLPPIVGAVQMTAKVLLTEIYVSAEISEVIKRLKPEDLQEDIKQHVFLELFTMDEAFILDLECRGKLKHFIVKMIYNTSRWTKSQFKKQFGQEIATDNFTDIAEQVYEEIDLPIEEIYWYKAEILKLYSEHGSYQKVAEITGIPVKSISNTVKQAVKEIKKAIV